MKKIVAILLILMLVLVITVSAEENYECAATETIVETVDNLDTPQILNMENKGDTVNITWSGVYNAETYTLYYQRAGWDYWKIITITSELNYIDKKFVSGMTYYYMVQANNENDSSDYSEPYEFTYLSTPKITSVKSNNNKGEVIIKWNAVTGANKYRVFYKRTDKNMSWKSIGNTNKTSFTDTGCINGKTYIYTVRCINDEGTKYTSYYNSAGVSIKYSYNAPPVLRKAAITSGDGSKAKCYITWDSVSGAYGYRVYYKRTASDGSVLGWKIIKDTTMTTMSDTGLKYGYKYTYTVRAIDSQGNLITSYDAKGLTLTINKTNVNKVTGFLINSASIDKSYAPYPIYLSDYDRSYAEQIIMGEAGNMSYEGIALCCQALRDAYVGGGYSSIAATISGMSYVAPLKTPSQEVKDVVRFIFDEAGAAAEHRVLVFYATNICSSGWHESQNFIYQSGYVRFFDMWYF